MGTNYYLKTNDPCPTCGRSDEDLHIGKSSAGWCFMLHVHPGLKELADWEAAWSVPGAMIYDEYGKRIEPDEMKRIITERSGGGWSDEQLRQNLAYLGPSGLARSRMARAGFGTYDLHEGYFS